MSKKLYPFILTIASILLMTFLWDKIIFPYENKEYIHGEYSINFFNPLNDTVRSVSFILFPTSIFFVSYLHFYKDRLFSIYEVVITRNTIFKPENNKYLNILIFIFIISLIMEFLLINFNFFSNSIDHPHDGMLLTPSNNAYLLNKYWISSYIERGFIAQFGLSFLWKFFDVKSVGLMHLYHLFFLLLNKILIIILAGIVSKNLLFNNNLKNIFFIILSTLTISLISYYDVGGFPPRLFIFLLFLIILYLSFNKKNKFSFIFFFLGSFSALSMFWYIDIGAYINVLCLLAIIYFSIRKEFKKMFCTLLGAITFWCIFALSINPYELKEFFDISLTVYSTTDFYNGLIYPTPFLSGDARSTKALLFFIIAGILLIIINFNKKIKMSNLNKIFLVFLFIASILMFKSAISRSDTPHIKTSTGINLFLIYTTLLYLLFSYFENSAKIKNFLNRILNLSLLKKINLILIVPFLLVLKGDIFNINKIYHSASNIKNLIYYKDEKYLTADYKALVNYYKDLTIDEKCIQIITNESTLPYFINKPSCTPYYFMYPVGALSLQKKFIQKLKEKKPKTILYRSEKTSWDFSKLQAPLLFDFIERNYVFYNKYKLWTFYKLKN